MAVTLQGSPRTQSHSEGAGATITIADVVVNSGTNRCLVVCLSGESDGFGSVEASDVDYGAQQLTRLVHVETSSWSWAEVWSLPNPNVGTTNDVVVTLTSADRVAVGIYVADGVSQSSPLRSPYTQNGTGTAASGTVAGVTANDLVFDVLCVDGLGHVASPGANQTERWDIEPDSGCTGASSTQLGSDGGDMSYSWTTSALFSYIATAFIPAETSQLVRPDADVITTGWTTTPLYSKINDESDATVIQATAS